MSLTRAQRAELARLLERTRSDVDTDVLDAARAAHRLLAGRTYAEVWRRPSPARTAEPVEPRWRRQAIECVRHPGALTPGEFVFVRGTLERSGKRLAPHKVARLERIAEKIELTKGLSF